MQILFLCTANSCRSILAEAIFNHMAPAGMQAYSAGSQPKGKVHPQSLAALGRAGISSEGLHSKGQMTHERLRPDLVITLCDSAANETCPAYFDSAIKAHWGLPDPDGQGSTQEEVNAVFDATIAHIKERIAKLLELPVQPDDSAAFSLAVRAIGERPLSPDQHNNPLR